MVVLVTRHFQQPSVMTEAGIFLIDPDLFATFFRAWVSGRPSMRLLVSFSWCAKRERCRKSQEQQQAGKSPSQMSHDFLLFLCPLNLIIQYLCIEIDHVIYCFCGGDGGWRS
ncbi:unnamed protein product [Amoebophrya sp. A120]|nr:unnamed protein product [Amoebophrya sp. A120]|eukprot:GSA120T00015003001.1